MNNCLLKIDNKVKFLVVVKLALLHGSYVIPAKAGMTSSRGLRLLAMTTLASTQAKFISIYSCEMKSWLRRLCKSSDTHVLSIRSAPRLTESLLFSKLNEYTKR
ncbi:hypothetical protein GRX81_01625 [Rickettsia japonica]|uniref:Uncharacterized protein n=1 Tax=Rickettsia japonica TaxID=35790 RepID=A0ABN5P0C6_RICJA|nr:hypothetical protein D0Z68_06940 [Rickettsia japonica]QHE24566.1 hypothetical protein GRX81_01625 [Rickettsia japonica]